MNNFDCHIKICQLRNAEKTEIIRHMVINAQAKSVPKCY